MNLATGRADVYYNLYNNAARNVAFNAVTGRPEDTTYQAVDARTAPQQHY